MALPLLPIAASIAAEFAPDLLRWLAGDKAGDVAQRIVDKATGAAGVSSPEAALGVLRTDPALAAKFQTDMKALDIELEKAYLEDRQDARKMSTEKAREGGAVAAADAKRKNNMIIMDTVGLVVGFAGMVALAVIKARYPEAISEGIFTALLVQLTGITSVFGLCLRDAHQFEFGSSRGSEQKTAMLAGQDVFRAGR